MIPSYLSLKLGWNHLVLSDLFPGGVLQIYCLNKTFKLTKIKIPHR